MPILVEQWICAHNKELLPLYQEGLFSEITSLLTAYGRVCRIISQQLARKPTIEQLSSAVDQLALQLQLFSLFLLTQIKRGHVTESNRPFLANISVKLQQVIKEKIEFTCQEFGLKFLRK